MTNSVPEKVKKGRKTYSDGFSLQEFAALVILVIYTGFASQKIVFPSGVRGLYFFLVYFAVAAVVLLICVAVNNGKRDIDQKRNKNAETFRKIIAGCVHSVSAAIFILLAAYYFGNACLVLHDTGTRYMDLWAIVAAGLLIMFYAQLKGMACLSNTSVILAAVLVLKIIILLVSSAGIYSLDHLAGNGTVTRREILDISGGNIVKALLIFAPLLAVAVFFGNVYRKNPDNSGRKTEEYRDNSQNKNDDPDKTSSRKKTGDKKRLNITLAVCVLVGMTTGMWLLVENTLIVGDAVLEAAKYPTHFMTRVIPDVNLGPAAGICVFLFELVRCSVMLCSSAYLMAKVAGRMNRTVFTVFVNAAMLVCMVTINIL